MKEPLVPEKQEPIMVRVENHSAEIQRRIEQASEKILKRNYNLYRRLENK